MEEITKRRALLCIDKVKDGEGRFACKAVGITLGVSKARASVILRRLADEGYCRKGDCRDFALLPKGAEQIRWLNARLRALEQRLDWAGPKARKEIVLLLLTHGSDELLSEFDKGKQKAVF